MEPIMYFIYSDPGINSVIMLRCELLKWVWDLKNRLSLHIVGQININIKTKVLILLLYKNDGGKENWVIWFLCFFFLVPNHNRNDVNIFIQSYKYTVSPKTILIQWNTIRTKRNIFVLCQIKVIARQEER